MKKKLLLALSLALASCDGDYEKKEVKEAEEPVKEKAQDPPKEKPEKQEKEPEPPLPPPEPKEKWTYESTEDGMGDVNKMATIESENQVEFGFPYAGLQNGALIIRKKKGLDVILAIAEGQFLCSLGCTVRVRFDEGEPMKWRANGPSDHSTTIIFLRKEEKFLQSLKKAKTVRIQSEFYQSGAKTFEFDVEGFDPSKLD